MVGIRSMSGSIPQRGEQNEPLPAPLQALVVTTPSWESIDGVVAGYERAYDEANWERRIECIPIVVGRNGMGWGIGMHPFPPPEGPVKGEGDGRTPAGIFRLSSTFGYSPVEEISWIRMPYRQITASLLCIDDPGSACYNRIVDVKRVNADWRSHEKMFRVDERYHYGIVVDHNVDPVVAGRGSCIFMHIWGDPPRATEGCTAMASNHLERLLLWLDPASMPILIQLPGQEYERLKGPWCLPSDFYETE